MSTLLVISRMAFPQLFARNLPRKFIQFRCCASAVPSFIVLSSSYWIMLLLGSYSNVVPLSRQTLFLIFACFVYSRAVWERPKRCAYPFITTILKLICLTAYRASVQLWKIGINHTTRKYRLLNIVISAELILSNHEKLVSSVPL